MKTGTLIILCVALIANCVSVRGDDTPVQAAARAALEQTFYQLDHSDGSALNTNSTTTPMESPEPAAMPVSVSVTTNVPAATRTTPEPDPARNVSLAPSKPAPVSVVPAENNSAQTIALAALKEKMNELNHAAAEPQPDLNSKEVSTVPAREASVAATPVTETPAAEIPAARAPAMTAAAVVPVAVAPVVAVPDPKVSTSPAVVVPSVAPMPTPVPAPVAVSAMTPAAVTTAVLRLPFSSPGHARPDNELTTTTGKSYRHVEVERVTEDGIVISYTPVKGGWATARIPFAELPAEIRQQFGK